MSALKWFLAIFSLNSDQRSKTPSGRYRSIARKTITAAIILSAHCFTLYYKMRYIFSGINISIKLTDTIQMLFDCGQYIVDLYFVHKYGRQISLEYFKQYECIDKILNMIHDSDVKKRVAKITGICGTFWMISTICDFTAWYLSYGLISPLIYSSSYVFLFIKILTTLDLTSQVLEVECRLRLLSDLVQGYYNNVQCLPVSSSSSHYIGDAIRNENWFYSVSCCRALKQQARPHPLKLRACGRFHEMKWLSRCYLLLTEQCTFLDKMFGIRILLNSLSLLIDMIRFTNIAVRILVGSQQTTYDSSYFPAVSSLMRMLTCVAVLVSLVEHCERAYRQRDRITTIIDHMLINKNPNEDLRSAATELRALIQTRPISFNMANFFELNYPFLVSTASVVVTYTIILLQNMD